MKRRRGWRMLGARRRIGPCRTCGASLALHNRAQRVFCLEEQAFEGEAAFIDAETLRAFTVQVRSY
jgi:hypothetical protein